LKVRKVRGEISFYSKALDQGTRSERALNLANVELYITGVSTRKVTVVTEKLYGLERISSEISRCTKLLDQNLEKWRIRPAVSIPHLILDVRYEKYGYMGLPEPMPCWFCPVFKVTGKALFWDKRFH